MQDGGQGNLLAMLSNLIAIALIGGGLYAIFRLSLAFAARRGKFTEKDLRAGGLNRDQRRAFQARNKRQNGPKSPFHSGRKRRTGARR